MLEKFSKNKKMALVKKMFTNETNSLLQSPELCFDATLIYFQIKM